MSHFDEMTLLLYLEGQMEADRAREIAAHLGCCEACRTLHAALVAESQLLRGALQEENESVPARLLDAPTQEQVPWGWLAGLGFAGAGAYTLWAGIIEPWQQQFSQAGFGEQNLLAMLFFGGVFWKGWDTVLSLMQLLAMGSLGALVLFLLRRNFSRSSTMAVVLSSLLVFLALPQAAAAAEIKYAKEGSYTLKTEETIDNDLIVFAGTVRIDGTVNGDLIVFAEGITVNGHVTGDVISFSRRVKINGQVDGDVRSFANTLDLSGTVAKNVTYFGESIEVDSKAQVSGGLITFVASFDFDGRVKRDLMAYFERGQLNGAVGGAARMGGDRLSVGASAEIEGKATFEGNREPTVSPQAKLTAGPIEFKKATKHGPDYTQGKFYWRKALSWGAALMCGVVIALLMPGFLKDSVRESERYVPAFLTGLVTLVATPILAIIACITVVGLAVGIIGLLVWAVALYASQVFVGAWIGQKILGAAENTAAVIGRLALGLLVIRVLGSLPYITFFVWLIVLLWGLGMVILAIGKRLRPEPALA